MKFSIQSCCDCMVLFCCMVLTKQNDAFQVCTVHLQYHSLYCPTNALNYINRSLH
jgi:hypothetical protein